LTPTRSFDRFWVLVGPDERVFGTIACSAHPIEGAPGLELKKCYLHPSQRGRGLARRLVALVEDHASSLGIATVELWSDTRFTTAHAVYEHLGYRRTGRERDLHDLSATREYHFVKRIPAAPDQTS
jgi:RimJ/RimL family protein N-acetyltransferase